MSSKIEVSRKLAEKLAEDVIGLSAKKSHWAAVFELRALLAAPVVERQPDAWLINGKALCFPSPNIVIEPEDVPLFAAPPGLAELQATIDRLMAEIEDWKNGSKIEADAGDEARAEVVALKAEIERLKGGQKGPIAYMRNEGVPNNVVLCGFDHPDAFKVYRAAPALVSVPPTLWYISVLDEPENPESPCEYFYADSEYHRDLLLSKKGSSIAIEYVCLDKVKELNP